MISSSGAPLDARSGRRRVPSGLVALGAIVFAATTLAVRPAAAGAGASLLWRREPGADACIDAATLERAVEERLGRKVFGPAERGELIVDGTIGHGEAGGWVAVVSLRGTGEESEGAREIRTEAASCSDLDAPLALVIALMLDLPTRRVVLHIPPPRAVRSERPQSGAVRLGASGVLGLGALPGAAAGIRLGAVVLVPGLWPFGVDGTYWFPARADDGSAQASIGMQYFSLFACPLRVRRARADLLACLGPQLGQVTASGDNLDQNDDVREAWWSVAAEARTGLRVVGPLYAQLGLRLSVPLTRTEVVYAARDGSKRELFRAFPVAATSEIGIGIEIP